MKLGDHMKIFFINHTGGGFASTIEVPDGTTLGQLFAERMPGCAAEDYQIRLNRAPASADERLDEGARVSFTPRKIEGAVGGRQRPRDQGAAA
jgi:hypothetical protein